MASVELYVYYKLTPNRTEAALAAFDALSRQLQEQLPGLQSRLLRRPVARQALQTWMEVHTWPAGIDAPPDWPQRLEHLAQPMAALLASPRQQELFEPI